MTMSGSRPHYGRDWPGRGLAGRAEAYGGELRRTRAPAHRRGTYGTHARVGMPFDHTLRGWVHARCDVEMQWLVLLLQPEDFFSSTLADHSMLGDAIVRVDPRCNRFTELETPPGDTNKAKGKLGWTTTVKLRGMVAAGSAAERRNNLVDLRGFQAYAYNQ